MSIVVVVDDDDVDDDDDDDDDDVDDDDHDHDHDDDHDHDSLGDLEIMAVVLIRSQQKDIGRCVPIDLGMRFLEGPLSLSIRV